MVATMPTFSKRIKWTEPQSSMDGWMKKVINGWTDGWSDDERMDRQVNIWIFTHSYFLQFTLEETVIIKLYGLTVIMTLNHE